MTIRVAFHQAAALRPTTGVGRYAAELLNSLNSLKGDLVVTGLPAGLTASAYRWTQHLLAARKPADRSIAAARSPRADAAASKPGTVRSMLRGGYRSAKEFLSWNVQRQLTPGRFDLYHEPNFFVLPTDLPTIVSIHDLSMILMPECHPADRVAAFEKQLPRALKQASHIITLSECVRGEIIREFGWPAERVHSIPLAARSSLVPLPVSQTQATLRSLGLPQNYLLCVGTLEPRKNLLRLMRAYARVPAERRERCPLLLVGGWGWNVGDVAEHLQSHGQRDGVIHLGHLDESHLGAIYNGARALMFPSLYEGFGLPPLEMMACGGAVIASTAGSVKEMFAGAAHLIDPLDEDAWTAAMTRAIADDDWIDQLRKNVLIHASTFSWRRCAEATQDVYLRALADARGRRAA